MKKAGIIFNSEKANARVLAGKIEEWLKKKGCAVTTASSPVKKLPELDFALSLGGDGTMLKASRMLSPLGVPVIGVNLGSLGFLAETNPEEIYTFLSRVISGNFQVEERTMLSVTIQTKSKTIRELALNEAVIHSGSTSRIVTISARVNDELLADYVGDGLIVATPTGSTAYSLAAYGPIAHPNLSVFIITPICPHTLTQRPFIISSSHTLVLNAKTKYAKEQPTLTIDGQSTYNLGPEDQITISQSEKPLKLIINPKRKYLQVLRTKLKWGERG